MRRRSVLGSLGLALPLVALWGVLGVCAGVPLAAAAVRLWHGVLSPGGLDSAIDAAALNRAALGRLGLTLGVAGLIGVLSMVIGAAPAWLVARRDPRWLAMLVMPLFLPASMAYAGWGMVRAPRTQVARWLEDLAQSGVTDAPVWAGRVLAILGLALWAWPLAMIASAPRIAAIDQDVLDHLRLDPRAWKRRSAQLRLALPALAGGAGVVALVMLGSAVPLHLAQIETDAIRLWRLLDQSSADKRWTAWVGAWPTVLASLAAGLWVASRLVRPSSLGWTRIGRTGTGGNPGRLTDAGLWVWALGAWGLSVLGPLFLFATSFRTSGAMASFWRLHAGGLVQSAGIAGLVGLIGGLMAAGVALGLMSGATSGRARAARLSLGPWLVAGILPGVLIGSATLDAWTQAAGVPGLGWVGRSPAIVVLAHVCRFGAVAAIAGVLVARSEPREAAALRELGCRGLRGWARSCPASAWLVIGGAGLAMAVLSLHEIESAVIVHPPGLDVLSRHLLQLLHFQRDEELSAAAVWMIALGAVPAALTGGAWAAMAARGRPRVAPQPGPAPSEPLSGALADSGGGIEPPTRGPR